MKKEIVVSLLLRIGVAFSFVYAAVQSFRDPVSWASFFPFWVRDLSGIIGGEEVLLTIFSVVEICVALWLLSGKFTFFAAMTAAAMLLGIVAVNIGAFDLVFRDVSIFFAALALAAVSKNDEGSLTHAFSGRTN